MATFKESIIIPKEVFTSMLKFMPSNNDDEKTVLPSKVENEAIIKKYPVLFDPKTRAKVKMSKYYEKKRREQTKVSKPTMEQSVNRDITTLKYFPGHVQASVHRILLEMRKRPDVLTYNEKYEVIVNGKLHRDSNFIEILTFIMSGPGPFITAYDVKGGRTLPRESHTVFDAMKNLFPADTMASLTLPSPPSYIVDLTVT